MAFSSATISRNVSLSNEPDSPGLPLSVSMSSSESSSSRESSPRSAALLKAKLLCTLRRGNAQMQGHMCASTSTKQEARPRSSFVTWPSVIFRRLQRRKQVEDEDESELRTRFWQHLTSPGNGNSGQLEMYGIRRLATASEGFGLRIVSTKDWKIASLEERKSKVFYGCRWSQTCTYDARE